MIFVCLIVCFAWLLILMGSFLVTAGLSCSVIFKLFSADELLLKAKKSGQNGVPGSQFCFILTGYLFMPFTYWISMKFYQNNISKAKIIWKIIHVVQFFYLRDEKMEPKGKNWLSSKHITRVRTWAKIQLSLFKFQFPYEGHWTLF